MLLKIAHHTEYSYDGPNDYTLQQQRLTPLTSPGQSVRRWEIAIDGGRQEAEYNDHFGNRVTLVSSAGGHHTISVRCEGEVETEDTSGVVGPHRSGLPLWYFLRPTDLTRPGAGVRDLVRELKENDAEGEGDIARMHRLSRAIVDRVAYETGKTHPGSSAEQVLEDGAGVCQDHAHIFVAAARLLEHPARYVSGYLMMQDRVDQDATHAWAEVHVDDLGWVGFDVSNGISPDEKYVRVATGLDYRDAAPIHGLRHGDANEALAVSVQVEQ